MYRKLGDTIYLDFTTHNPSTGAVSDADSLPTCEVFEDDSDTAILSPTVTKRTGKTGNYRVPIAATAGNGFEVGKSYNVVVSAMVNSVAAKGVIGSFSLDSIRGTDLDSKLGSPAGASVSADLAAIKSDSAAILNDTGTSGVVLPQAQADKVWNTAVRALTDKAGFTISGTKQTLDALQDLSQAQAQAGATAALNAYDPPTKAEMDAGFAALNDITVAEILSAVVEGTLTLDQVLRIMLAVLAGKSTGGGTGTFTFRDMADTKARITATVDANKNRTAVVRDGT